MHENKIKLNYIIILQLGVILYSTAGVIGKIASSKEMFSFPFLALFAAEFIVLAIYAILWQQMIKRVDISIAYANRSTALLWSTIWAPLIFKETITKNNVIGIVLVVLGTVLINTAPSGKEESQ